MNMFYLLPLMASPDGAAAASGGAAGGLMSFVPFILIIAIFYFLIIRPQNKKQKETQKMLAALKKGDKIVTIGGIYGTIVSTKENSVVVRVDDDVKMEFSRSAISQVTVPKEEKEDAKESKDAKKGKGDKTDALAIADKTDTVKQEDGESDKIGEKSNE